MSRDKKNDLNIIKQAAVLYDKYLLNKNINAQKFLSNNELKNIIDIDFLNQINTDVNEKIIF